MPVQKGCALGEGEMAKCCTCDGTGVCHVCGDRRYLTINAHPSPPHEKADVLVRRRASTCYMCMGKDYCPDCKGTGER